MKVKIVLFILGGLCGFLVAALFQPLIRPLVTDAFRDEGDVTEGRVVGKRLQGERLLLTVDAAEGTVLATFEQRVPEIDMLVEEGDLVKLGVPRYEPFVEDPPILAVRKQELPGSEARRPAAVQERPRPPETGIIPGVEPRADAPPEGEPEPAPEPVPERPPGDVEPPATAAEPPGEGPPGADG